MNIKKYYLFVFFITLPILGKTQINSKVEIHPKVNKKSIKNFHLNEGTYDISFKLTNKENWPIKISVPKIKEGEKLPLIIALHWAGDQNTYKDYGDCLAFPALESLNGIIVVPSSNFGNWMDPKNEERVIDFVRKAIKFWPIEKDNVIITGYSNGGIASWNFVAKYPKLFSVGIPMAGFYDPSKIKIPLYVIHGQEDELFNCNKIQSVVESSINRGSTIDFKIVSKMSHYMACSYVEALQETVLKIKENIFKN